MGYEVVRRTALLRLHDDYEGAEIRVKRDVSLKVRFELVRLYTQLSESQEDAQGAANLSHAVLVTSVAALEQVYTYFCEHYLVEWNLEQDGQSIEANLEGFLTLPPELATAVVQTALEAGNAVPSPLGGASSNGDTPEDGLVATGNSTMRPQANW